MKKECKPTFSLFLCVHVSGVGVDISILFVALNSALLEGEGVAGEDKRLNFHLQLLGWGYSSAQYFCGGNMQYTNTTTPPCCLTWCIAGEHLTRLSLSLSLCIYTYIYICVYSK